jgi:hypothetical protein
MSLSIRALDPIKDQDLFAEAYSWRTVKRLARSQEGVIDFAGFSHPEPNEVAMGLFNGRLQAVFLIQDHGRGSFETHFTCKPGTSRETLSVGALTIKNWLFEKGGAREVYGWLRERHAYPNHPVRKFVESIGMFEDLHCQKCVFRGTLTLWWRRFVAKR